MAYISVHFQVLQGISFKYVQFKPHNYNNDLCIVYINNYYLRVILLASVADGINKL